MNRSFDSRLLDALTAEHAALLDFVALLKSEQEMLVENSTDRLLELAEKKTNSALILNAFAETRQDLLKKNFPRLGDPGAEAIYACLDKHAPQGSAVWNEVLALASRAQQLNRTNGELIQMKLRHNQQALAVLSSSVKKTHIYGPDGQTRFSPGSGRSLGSG